MGVVELDGDEIFSRFSRHIRDAATSVLPVLEIDLGLGRSLHCDGKTASASLASPDHELVRKTDLTWNGER